MTYMILAKVAAIFLLSATRLQKIKYKITTKNENKHSCIVVAQNILLIIDSVLRQCQLLLIMYFVVMEALTYNG